jgi:hypothetical protein
MKALLVVLLSCFPGIGFADFIPSRLVGGTYVTEGYHHYLDGKLTVSEQGRHYHLNGILARDGRFYEMAAQVWPTHSNFYSGSGQITVTYPEYRQCHYRFQLEIWSYEGKFYLSENTPVFIPYNSHGGCGGDWGYSWFNHGHPYQLTKD